MLKKPRLLSRRNKQLLPLRLLLRLKLPRQLLKRPREKLKLPKPRERRKRLLLLPLLKNKRWLTSKRLTQDGLLLDKNSSMSRSQSPSKRLNNKSVKRLTPNGPQLMREELLVMKQSRREELN